ncbi:ANTAR domain-containing protein, partial [Mycobacteroides chelonae]
RQVAATLDEIRRTAQAFSTRHRIIDLQQRVHHVVVIGDRLYDDRGTVIGTHGFYVDVTPSAHQDHEDSLTAAVVEIAESRGIIEQAKGMLMLVYRLNADAAFELLKWRSQENNVKLRALAQQIVTDFQSLDFGMDLPARSEYDRLLLTTHQRVPQ